MKRSYIPTDFKITDWESLKPYFVELTEREIKSSEELYKWFLDRSELESVVSEDQAWRYIKMTCDTTNKEISDAFNFFVSKISPEMAPYSNLLDKKALESPYLDSLKGKEGFDIVIKLLKKDKEIYRDENVPLFSELEQKAHQFGAISGAMTIQWEGKELTLQQAADFLLKPDRQLRESVWKLIQERRYQDKDALNNLYTELIAMRQQVAINAGFDNFRDYMFVAMGRFDYNKEACYDFHESIKEVVVPILTEFAKERVQGLKIDSLRPWDLAVNYASDKVLKAFEDGNDLVDKTIVAFGKVDSYLGDCIKTMKEMNHLDVMSRKGKAPGGYNYPLDESGVPFIFMNATQSLRDLVTMVHEGGHALHSFVTADLPLNTFKHPTSEVAELASMSMELISMEYWDVFFTNPDDLKRAKKEHLESVIQTLPWVATVDRFQHVVYEKPNHTLEEREQMWLNSYLPYSNPEVNWNSLEKFRNLTWQKQLHLFEVPFYYIEYGMAQLGAIAVWKKYKEDKVNGYKNYKAALELGYKKSIPEIYKTAGIKFDFTKEYIKELMQFVLNEYKSI
ncbi:MAG: M3 family oligoendopeptidase [Cytophagaceae bacterium]